MRYLRATHSICTTYSFFRSTKTKKLTYSFVIGGKPTWDDGTLLEIVQDTLPVLPANDKGLLPQFLHLWTRGISNLPKLSETTNAETASTNAKEKCQTSFDVWQEVLVSNPEFTVSLLREIVVHNAGTGAANKENPKQLLSDMISGSMHSGFLHKKVARALLTQLSQINSEE